MNPTRIPMLTLIASLSAGLVITTADSALARNDNNGATRPKSSPLVMTKENLGISSQVGSTKNGTPLGGGATGGWAGTGKPPPAAAPKTPVVRGTVVRDHRITRKPPPVAASKTPVVHDHRKTGGSTGSRQPQPVGAPPINGATRPKSSPLVMTKENLGPPSQGGSAKGGNVTISNGVTKYEMPNGPGGVAVYSDKPGTITVTNGKETKTFNGGSVNLSGNVEGIGAGQGLQVGKRNSEGNTPIAIGGPGGHFNGDGTPFGGGSTGSGKPPPAAAPKTPVARDHRGPANTPGAIIRDRRNGADGQPKVVVKSEGGVVVTRRATEKEIKNATDTRPDDGLFHDIWSGIKKVAPPYGFESPPSPPKTSTITQQ